MTATGLAQIEQLERSAERITIPFVNGSFVWRRWGGGASVILLHGGSGSWKHWIRNIGALAERFEVWAPDLPGYGESDLPEAPAFPVFTRMVMESFQHLRPGAKARIAGFSFGSVLAAYVARQYPQQIAATLIINGHLIGKAPARPQRNMTRWRNIEEPTAFNEAMRHNLSQLMLSNEAAIDDLAVAIYGEDLRRSRLRALDVMATRDTEVIRGVPAPLVTISGGSDPVAFPDVAEQVRKLKQARPDALCHVLEGVGHWAMYEAADRVNGIMLEALRHAAA